MTTRYFTADKIRFPERLREGDVWSTKGLRFEGGKWVPYRKRSNALDNDWTPAEDDRLRAHFAAAYAGTDKRTLAEFAAELGRTPSSCHSRAGKSLGITRPRAIKGGFCTAPVWSDEEHAILDEWYPREPIGEILKRLPGRSKSSVYVRAQQRGLISPYAQKYSGWTKREQLALRIAFNKGLAIADVAIAVGRNPLTVSKYALNHGLDFGRRPLLAESPSLELILSLEDPAIPLPALLNKVAMRRGLKRKQSAWADERELQRRERQAFEARRKKRRQNYKEMKRRTREEQVALERQRRADVRANELAQRRIEREQARQFEQEQRSLARARQRETAILQRQFAQAARDRDATIANHRLKKAAMARATAKAERLLASGATIGRGQTPDVKLAYQALVRAQAQAHRDNDPIEQAKLKLQRRYAPVCSMAVYGGKKGFYMVGTRRDVPEAELLAMAERLAA